MRQRACVCERHDMEQQLQQRHVWARRARGCGSAARWHGGHAAADKPALLLLCCAVSCSGSNYWSAGVFLATRTPFMCGAVHLTKHLIKRYLLHPHRQGRHKKLVHALTIVLDQLLPTAFYGRCP